MPKNVFEVVLENVDTSHTHTMGYDTAEEIAVQYAAEPELRELKKLEDDFDGTVQQAKKLIADNNEWATRFRAIYKESASPEVIEIDISRRKDDLKIELQALADKQNDYVRKQQEKKREILEAVKNDLTLENAKEHLTSTQIDYIKTMFDLGIKDGELINVLAQFNYNPMLLDLVNVYRRSNKTDPNALSYVPIKHPAEVALGVIGGRTPLSAGQIKLDNSWLTHKF